MPKKIVQQAKVRTNTTKDSVCKINVPAVAFADLWKNYVSGGPYRDPKTKQKPKGFENQCAIQMSATLHKVGIEMKSFSQNHVNPTPGKTTLGRILLDGKATSTRADELASWLNKQPFCGLPKTAENVTGQEWVSKVKGRTGIIFFGKYWTRDNETAETASGGHIDLWNGSKLTGGGIENFMRFTLGIQSTSILQFYSDLRKSKTILFFEIK